MSAVMPPEAFAAQSAALRQQYKDALLCAKVEYHADLQGLVQTIIDTDPCVDNCRQLMFDVYQTRWRKERNAKDVLDKSVRALHNIFYGEAI